MNKNIEQLVKKILQAEKISSPPIDAEQLAEFHFDLNIDWRPLADADAMAALSVAQKKIFMNESRADELAANIGLKNFTIAHELGHWVLHRHLASEKLFGIDGEVLICREVNNSQRGIEREADLFAMHLLMPENFVRAEFAKIDSPLT